MNYALGLASIVLFIIGFRYTGVVAVASRAIARTRGAVAILADRGKSEAEKERAAQQAAVILFGQFLLITALAAAAFVAPVLLLAGAVWAGFAEEPALMSALLSPQLIAASVVLFVLDYAIRR